MDLWEKALAELVDIVEWIDESNDTMVWRFPRYENEIKYGAQLVVRQAQAAVFAVGALAGLVGVVFLSRVPEPAAQPIRRRPLRDAVIAVLFAALAYLGFDTALGIRIGAGPLGGVI